MAARSGKHQSKSEVFSKAESPLLCVYDVLLNIIALPRLSPESEQRTRGSRREKQPWGAVCLSSA